MLSVIKGQRIKEITTEHGYLNILFANGETGLNIFNNYSTDAGSLQDLVEKCIEGVYQTDDSIRITFDNGNCLQIGMRDCDYSGPQSLIYFTPSDMYVETYASARTRYHQFRP